MRLAVLILAGALVAACGQKQLAPGAGGGAELAARPTGMAVIDLPGIEARVTTPVIVTGVAPNDWYFEGQFTARLIGADGAELASGPARAQTDWTTPGPVPFRAEIVFDVIAETPAALVLEEEVMGQDMPDAPAPRQVSQAIKLVPTKR
jgi:hypothetical protein